MKIFFYALREFDELPLVKQYAEEYGIGYGYSTEYPNTENLKLLKGYDAVSCTPCDMSAPVLRQLKELGIRYVLCRSIGYDHVDLAEAQKLGMRVANVGYPADSVANYAIMCLLMCSRKIGHILKRSELQDYSLKGKLGRDLSSLTVGVIGTGHIGTTVIKHLSGFGCRILASDPYPNKEAASIAEYVPLNTLFQTCDAITIHANATAENTHLLNAEAFHQMKKGVIIVNTSRGKLIDTDALIDALHEGIVSEAALDVLENENGLYYVNRCGDVIDNPEMAQLRSFPNVLLLPHTAFYTDIDVTYMVKGCFEAADAFEKHQPCSHEVGKH